jgi:uncharacterized membrane protein YgcG
VPQEQLDLAHLTEMLGRASISIDPEESPEEHTARIAKEQREATFEIVKGYVLFFVIVIAIILIGALCAYEAAFDSTATVDTKRVAWTILSALFTGSVSFVLGQRSAKVK